MNNILRLASGCAFMIVGWWLIRLAFFIVDEPRPSLPAKLVSLVVGGATLACIWYGIALLAGPI